MSIWAACCRRGPRHGHALSNNQAVDEGGLQAGIEDVVRRVWAYCCRHGDDVVRTNLMDAFVARLRGINAEKPGNTGCVQRLLQTPEAIDLEVSREFAAQSALEEEISRLAARIDGLLDQQAKTAILQHLPKHEYVGQLIQFRYQEIGKTVLQNLMRQRRLPEGLATQALHKGLDHVESNELYLHDMTLREPATDRNHRDDCKNGRAGAVQVRLKAKGIEARQIIDAGYTARSLASLNGHTEIDELLKPHDPYLPA